MNGIDIDVGPTRHGITRGHTDLLLRSRSATATRCSRAATSTDHDWETITWTEDQFGKALFYYENRAHRLLRLHLHLTQCGRPPATTPPPTCPLRGAPAEPRVRPAGRTSPAFVTKARERATRRALAELDAPNAPPGRTEAFARETVAPRELQWPESMRPRSARSTDVRLIRHGQTQGYVADSALTPLGRWQAHRKGQDLAKGMQDGGVARIVHAPTARAIETAIALAEGLRQAVARYGIRDVTIDGPFRSTPSATSRPGSTAASSTSLPPSRSSPTCSRATSATAAATGPAGWSRWTGSGASSSRAAIRSRSG